ncbi:MAG: protein kinase [Planctomycetota bacterium]
MNEPRRSIAEPTLDGEPPTLNDRYQVRRLIGKGGMGAVYLVYDRQIGAEVALKSFPPQARRQEDLAHFEHEFLTLSRLRHPNVAEVYDFGVIEGTEDVFFTSEFIDGTDLFEYSDGLGEAELIQLIVQVCRGLEYIHSRQIIHYDVKPTNILVTRDEPPRVKIIDFGLAAEHVDEALGIIKGTVSFLAPEVATHRNVDHRADLYSLGVTLFQCVTRQLPFRGDTNLDVLRKHVTDPIPDPADFGAEVSSGLRRVIKRLLSKDPGGRYQSGNLLIRELTRICGEDFAIEPREQALTFVTNGGFFGREREVQVLHEAFAQIFRWSEQPPAPPGASGSPLERSASGHLVLSLESEPDLEQERRPTDSTKLSSGRHPRAPEPPPELPERLRHVFLVTGELGVGKSRLLREFKTHCQLRRVAVVEGHAATIGSSYEPFVEVLRGILGLYYRDPDESAAGDPLRPQHTDPLRRDLLLRYGRELEQLVPELDLSDLRLPERARLDPGQEELRLLDSLSQFLIGYGRKRPLVVLLHDLEKADLQAWELLSTLCRNLVLVESARKLAQTSPLRLLVVASFRPSELSPAQREVLRELPQPSFAELQIGPLTRDEVFALIESMLGRGSNPRRLADAIYAETRGNPYFTTEVLRSLAESGGLRQEDGRWVAKFDEPGSLIVPDSVSEVILSRVAHTSTDERGPLNWLAVLGRSSTLRELADLSGEPTPELAAQLGGLERRQVVLAERGAAGPALRYDFVHLLARDAVYQSMDPGYRRQLHERCGEVLEERVREELGAVDLGELVRHFDQAGNRQKALEYGIRAGDQACSVHAYHRAIDLFTSAMGLLPEGSPRRRGLYLRTGDLLALTGDVAQAVAIYERVLETEEALGPEEHARVVRGLGQLRAQQGDFDGALEVLADGALRHFGDEEHRHETAGLFTAAAAIYLRTGRYADALQFAETALSQLGDLSEGAETLEAVTVRGRALLAQGEVVDAEREFRRALALARRGNETLRQARALTDLGQVALSTGRAAEAVERFQQALRLETRLGHAAGIARNSRALARANVALGHTDRALDLFRKALALHEKLGAPAERVDVFTDLGRAQHHVGDYAQALETLAQAHAEAERLGTLDLSARALNAHAEVLERLGDRGRAHELATEALRQASLSGDVPRERARALEILGRLALDDDVEQGEQLLHQAQALFRAQGDRSGVLRTTLALLRVFLEREDTLLVEGTLGGVDPEGLSLRDRAWLTHTRIEATLRLQKKIPRALLGELERAAGWAEATRDRELAWRVAASRGRALLLLKDAGSALEAYVEAMSGLRVLCQSVPEDRRQGYVRHPDCQRCHNEFTDLRRRLEEGSER